MRVSYSGARQRVLYDRAPVVVQNALTTAYGYRRRAATHRRFYREALESLRETQWWDEERIIAARDARCSGFMRQAASLSPYWAEEFQKVGLPPDAAGVESLEMLPVLFKERVCQNIDRIVSRPWATGVEKGVPVHTSGTTGTGLSFVASRECAQWEFAFRDLHRSWGGYRPGDSVATIAGHPVVPIATMTPPFWRRNAASNQTLFSSQHMTRATLPMYLEELRRLKPALIHGFPSSLYIVASFCLESGETGIRPKSVFTHSETLLDGHREAIEQAFGCKVFDWYGTTEAAANFVECEHGRMHIKHEYSLVEFLRTDGTHAAAGEYARVVGTAFGNLATPLIRYDTGDMAVLAADSCTCGRPGPIVERILGRQEDIFVTPDGRMVGILDHPFKDARNVVEAQLVQEQPSLVVVRLVRRERYSSADEAMLAEGLRLRLGALVRVVFEYVDHIPREANGKYRFAVSRVPLPGSLRQAADAEPRTADGGYCS